VQLAWLRNKRKPKGPTNPEILEKLGAKVLKIQGMYVPQNILIAKLVKPQVKMDLELHSEQVCLIVPIHTNIYTKFL